MYKILGADQKEYGPVSADQLRQWITEGRANAQTMVFAEGGTEWKALGSLPEFAQALTGGRVARPQPMSAPRTNGMALTGMIMGIVACPFGLCCCYIGMPLGVLGLIFSLVGLSQIRANPETQSGKGLAIAGLILSLLSFLVVIGFLVFGLAAGGLENILRDLNKM